MTAVAKPTLSTSSRDSKWVIGAFLALALAKLLLAIVVVPLVTNALGANYHSDLFPDDYDLIAQNLITGHGYRVYPDTSETMLRSPGFVIVLAAIFMVFGKSLFAVQIIQSLMSIATSVIVYLIARRLIKSDIGALFAAAIFLFHPVSLLSDTRGGVDTTLTLSLALSIWLLLKAIESGKSITYAICGLVIGYTMLVKASVALIFPFLFAYLVLKRYAKAFDLFRGFVLMAIMASLVMVPWVARNYMISGHFVPTMTVAGLAIFQGEQVQEHSESGKDSWELLDDASQEQLKIADQMGLRVHPDFFPQFYSVTDEIRFYNELAQRAWSAYRDHPTLLAKAIVHNAWAFWFQGRTVKATLINVAIMLPFLLLACWGGYRLVPGSAVGWILVIAVITYVMPHLVIISVARYSSTVIPFLSIFVAGVWFQRRTAETA
jgi:4-amino-4-deoxy-L-arabinose transferase-like glycosyltransferase